MQVWLTLLHEVRLRKPSIMTKQDGKINLLSGHIEVSEMVPFLIWIIRKHWVNEPFQFWKPSTCILFIQKGQKIHLLPGIPTSGLKERTSKKMSQKLVKCDMQLCSSRVTFEVDFSFKHWENQEVQDLSEGFQILGEENQFLWMEREPEKSPTKFSKKVETLPSFSEKGILCVKYILPFGRSPESAALTTTHHPPPTTTKHPHDFRSLMQDFPRLCNKEDQLLGTDSTRCWSCCCPFWPSGKL